MVTEPTPAIPEIKIEQQTPIAPSPPIDLDKFVRPLRVDMTIRGNVVANKYLEPPVNVYLADEALLPIARYVACTQASRHLTNATFRQGRLRVTSTLILTLSDTIINKTLDNKQEILQVSEFN